MLSKFSISGGAGRPCPICGKTLQKAQIPGYPAHPACSKKMQELHKNDKRPRRGRQIKEKQLDGYIAFTSKGSEDGK